MIHHGRLSRREREIMEILYRRGSGRVSEVRGEMAEPPGYSAVRATMNILERKGYLRHVVRGNAYVYSAVTPRKKAIQGAVSHLLITYFDNSLPKAVTALLALRTGDLSDAEAAELQRLIRESRKEGPP
jgi:BlaI family transcriptional regulator, penicillinase repressor